MSSAEKNHVRLSELLDAYGSDLSRWPLEDRLKTEALNATDQTSLLRDDRAMDQLLREASAKADATPASDELMARILAKTSHASETRADAIADIASRETGARELPRPLPASRWQRVSNDALATAALLAASLVLGFFVGTTDLGRTTAANIGDLAGLDRGFTSMQTTALDDALHFQDDEDIL